MLSSVTVVSETANSQPSRHRGRRKRSCSPRRRRYTAMCCQKIQALENGENGRNVIMPFKRRSLSVRVQNPLTHIPLDGKRYTTYEIAVETNDIAFNLPKSFVRRRYSEFVWFRKRLLEAYPELKVPTLPPRTLWGGQFDPFVIETRLRGLWEFLVRVLSQRLFLSDSVLHLFLQTSLPTDQITDITEGRTDKSVIDTVLEAGSVPVLLKRCDTCEQSLASSSGYDSSSCSSDDCVTPDPCHRAGSSTADVTEVAPGGVQTEGAMVLLLSSTPCESPGGLDTVVAGLSISGHSLDSALSQISISKDDSDIDSSLSASCSPPSQSVYRSVLSQSVPTTQIPPKCQHRRRRRVTFSTEVTVAKVIDKSDQAEDSCKVTLVRVHTVKDKTKGH